MDYRRIINLLEILLLFSIFFMITLAVPVFAGADSQKFIAISSDSGTTIALDENGCVWLWGRVYDQAGSPAYDQNTDQYQQFVGDSYYRV